MSGARAVLYHPCRGSAPVVDVEQKMPRKNARPAARKRRQEMKARMGGKPQKPKRVAMIAHHAPRHSSAAMLAMAMAMGGMRRT